MKSDMIVSGTGPVCIVGGATTSPSALSQVAAHAATFVGVDGGADHLARAGISPAAVIGDMDSLSKDVRRAHASVLHHIADQATTDFEKTIARVAAPVLIALGFTGGRLDHSLSVLNAMRMNMAQPVVLLDAHDASFFVAAGVTSLSLPVQTRISVMPVTPATVTLDGVVWPFADQPMAMGGFTSPSNESLGGAVQITTDAPVLVTLPAAHLAVALKAVVRGQ